MRTTNRSLLLSSAISLSLIACSGMAFAADSPEAANARHEARISTTYALSPYLRTHNLQVSVNGDTATLTGSVPEDVNRDLAEQIALGAKGVAKVDNQIIVVADYVAPTRGSERSYAELIEDAGVTTAVKSKLLWSRTVDGIAASVETRNGHVALSGTAPSSEARAEAGSLARHTRGVIAVDNQLVVQPKVATTSTPTPGSTPTPAEDGILDQAGEAVSDSWITMKVKSTLMYSSNVSSNDVSVSTADGVVTLSGKMDSGAERALAISLSENVRGVKSVQSTGLTLIAAR